MASKTEEETRKLETIEEKENYETATDDQSKCVPNSPLPKNLEGEVKENAESSPRQAFCKNSPMRS